MYRANSRRRFIKKVGTQVLGSLAIPYIIPSSALGKSGSVAPSDRIGMGFIGMGGQGRGNMAGGDFSHIPGEFMGKAEVQARAVCDVDAERKEQAKDLVNQLYGNKDCAAYGDYRELLEREDIDAIMVATPDHWHALIGIHAMKKGIDVYGEKPLAHNIIEGRAIADAQKRFGAVWQTGCQQRSWQEFRTACEMVRNGRIGELKMVKVSLPEGTRSNYPIEPIPVPDHLDYDLWLGPAPMAPYCRGRLHGSFRNISDYSSGPIADWAGHHVDIAQWGMGTDDSWPSEIEGKGTFNQGGLFDNMISYHIQCKYEDGHTLIIEDSGNREKGKNGKRYTPGCFGLNIGILFEGTEGWIQVNRGGLDVYPESIMDRPIQNDEIHLYYSNDHKQNFLDCIKSRNQTVSPPDVTNRSVGIGYLGIISMKLGRKLRFDGNTERFINDPEANRMLYRNMRSPWHF
jgi:predicted dehydrogenase